MKEITNKSRYCRRKAQKTIQIVLYHKYTTK